MPSQPVLHEVEHVLIEEGRSHRGHYDGHYFIVVSTAAPSGKRTDSEKKYRLLQGQANRELKTYDADKMTSRESPSVVLFMTPVGILHVAGSVGSHKKPGFFSGRDPIRLRELFDEQKSDFLDGLQVTPKASALTL